MNLEKADQIPAMTTLAERACYYRYARQHAPYGAVIELGCWLGAATTYIAAGMRDSGSTGKLHVYDRFQWDPSHEEKGATSRDNLASFKKNVGEFLPNIDIVKGEISDAKWRAGHIAMMVCDAPKRIREISNMFGAFGAYMGRGTIMAWQDFAYFPSYDIAAAMMRLCDYMELRETVYPGTTAVFELRQKIPPGMTTMQSLSLGNWGEREIVTMWERWSQYLQPEMRPRFMCGAVMFLYDRGYREQAWERLEQIAAEHPAEVLPKWQYLYERRPPFRQRYVELFERLLKKELIR